MRYRIRDSFWPVGLTLLALAAAAVLLLGAPAAPGRAAGVAPQSSVARPPEVWRMGVISEGDPAFASVIGRLVGATASFRSSRGVADIYYIFPAPASARTVQSAAVYLADRTGTYTSTASLALEVRSFDGSLLRTVSATPVDLQAAPADAWTDLALASTPASLAIAPGEYLAFHFSLGGGSAGDLNVRPIFEVVLE